MADNPQETPYQSPSTESSPTPQPVFARTVAASHGKEWVSTAWSLFKQTPWSIIGCWIVLMVLTMAAGTILPIVGSVFTPALFAGFACGIERLQQTGRFDIADLFQGLQSRAIPLILLGVILILTIGVIALLVSSIAAVMLTAMSSGHMTLILALTLVCILTGLTLTLMIVFAMAWAPCLVYFDHQKPAEAIKNAIRGMLKNVNACLIYSLMVFLLYLGVLLTAGLGMLVVGPLLMIAMYTSYRDIFVAYED